MSLLGIALLAFYGYVAMDILLTIQKNGDFND